MKTLIEKLMDGINESVENIKQKGKESFVKVSRAELDSLAFKEIAYIRTIIVQEESPHANDITEDITLHFWEDYEFFKESELGDIPKFLESVIAADGSAIVTWNVLNVSLQCKLTIQNE